MHKRHSLLLLTALSPFAVVTQNVQAQNAGDESLEQVVVTGTRVADRSVLETAVPVDVVSNDSLRNLGVTEINQALSVALPSFNFPRPGLADGTDTIRPATLRGLAPDQTLVLVNGKRRHSASLVNLNGTIGRGAAAVDMNTIPNGIVKSIEVLRDGASAQYGSDAIAGVINVRLRNDKDGGDVGVQYGWRDSEYTVRPDTNPALGGGPAPTWNIPARISRSVSDGETFTASAWKGFGLGENGFVTVAAEYKDQERTERDGYDTRPQYPLINGQYDPREQTYNRFDGWYGEPELEQKTLFVNSGYDLDAGASLYGWASYQDRDARSAGFIRPARDDRNVIQIYPNGFLPLIVPEVTDLSAAGGVTWKLGEWDMDSSLVYGRNKMEFTIDNTLNRSLGVASKTTFDAGGFAYDQLVLNVAGVREVKVGSLASPLNVAIGVEARREGYEIFAGEPDSYRNGGVLLNNLPTPSGSQVFPGFRPENEVDKHRTAIGGYVDLEANVTDQFLASAALRGEHYSDFGDSFSGKLSGRYDFTPGFALRASVQNGFRAPSLQQQYFTSTSTNFINGVPFDITTFPATSAIAAALGAKPLDAEESVNYSIGAVIRVADVSITIDAYRIDIDDRIVLSENLTAANVRNYLTSLGFVGVGGGRFFINGVDTKTEGVDIVMHWPFAANAAGRFDLTLTANFNSTDVERVPQTAQLAALNPAPVLFDRVNVLTFEEGNPDSKLAGQLNWQLDRWGATFRVTRYGEVLTPGTPPAAPAPVTANDFKDDPTTLVDLEARIGITDSLKISLGADNVFDEYPGDLPGRLNTTGNAPFSQYAPFGRGGRFLYGKLTYDF